MIQGNDTKIFPDELRTKEMIQKFLGCLNYSSDFIKDLAKERQELQKLLTKKNQTGWNDKHTMIVRRKTKNLNIIIIIYYSSIKRPNHIILLSIRWRFSCL